jgi:hypothetical protein
MQSQTRRLGVYIKQMAKINIETNPSQAYRRHSHEGDGNVVRNPSEKNIPAESVTKNTHGEMN